MIDPVLREFPELRRRGCEGAREPHRPVRDRRPEGRHRSDRPQDHRRYLRWHGARTAAARSAARTPRRSTGPPRTWRGTSRRTSWPPASPIACQLQVAYAIGTAHPVSLMVDTFGTETGRPGEARGGDLGGLRLPAGRRSSATSTSAGRSTARPRPTGTSVARSSRGRRPTASTRSASASAPEASPARSRSASTARSSSLDRPVHLRPAARARTRASARSCVSASTAS